MSSRPAGANKEALSQNKEQKMGEGEKEGRSFLPSLVNEKLFKNTTEFYFKFKQGYSSLTIGNDNVKG